MGLLAIEARGNGLRVTAKAASSVFDVSKARLLVGARSYLALTRLLLDSGLTILRTVAGCGNSVVGAAQLSVRRIAIRPIRELLGHFVHSNDHAPTRSSDPKKHAPAYLARAVLWLRLTPLPVVSSLQPSSMRARNAGNLLDNHAVTGGDAADEACIQVQHLASLLT